MLVLLAVVPDGLLGIATVGIIFVAVPVAFLGVAAEATERVIMACGFPWVRPSALLVATMVVARVVGEVVVGYGIAWSCGAVYVGAPVTPLDGSHRNRIGGVGVVTQWGLAVVRPVCVGGVCRAAEWVFGAPR